LWLIEISIKCAGGKKNSIIFNRFHTFFSLFYTFFQIFLQLLTVFNRFKHELLSAEASAKADARLVRHSPLATAD
jgi:hypothetical protein